MGELLNLLCTSSPLEFHTLTLASAQQSRVLGPDLYFM